MKAGKMPTVTSRSRETTIKVEVDASTAMASDFRNGENVPAMTLGKGQLVDL
jgi:hypothetical protein